MRTQARGTCAAANLDRDCLFLLSTLSRPRTLPCACLATLQGSRPPRGSRERRGSRPFFISLPHIFYPSPPHTTGRRRRRRQEAGRPQAGPRDQGQGECVGLCGSVVETQRERERERERESKRRLTHPPTPPTPQALQAATGGSAADKEAFRQSVVRVLCVCVWERSVASGKHRKSKTTHSPQPPLTPTGQRPRTPPLLPSFLQDLWRCRRSVRLRPPRVRRQTKRHVPVAPTLCPGGRHARGGMPRRHA